MNNENLNATLRCVTRPSAAQEEKIKTFLKNKYQAENITLTISIDPSVRGGFILSANNDEYDWSTRSRQQQLQEQIQAARDKAIQMKKDGTLMSILKEAIEQFEATSQENEVGYVETIGDGIATISGLDHAMYGEVVVLRMVQKEWYSISQPKTSVLFYLIQKVLLVKVQRFLEQKTRQVCQSALIF